GTPVEKLRIAFPAEIMVLVRDGLFAAEQRRQMSPLRIELRLRPGMVQGIKMHRQFMPGLADGRDDLRGIARRDRTPGRTDPCRAKELQELLCIRHEIAVGIVREVGDRGQVAWIEPQNGQSYPLFGRHMEESA